MSPISIASSLQSDIATRNTVFRLVVDTKQLDALPDIVHTFVRDAVNKGALDLQAAIQQEIRAKNLIKTGNLLNSVSAVVSLDGMSALVIVGAFYGIYLEFGTVRMAARPFFGPAFDAFSALWVPAVEQNVKRLLQIFH